jgi:large subunit ribosomal protein L18
MNERYLKRAARARRVRAKVSGTADRPRLAVHRSLRNLSVQVIDDTTGRTLASVDLRELGKGAKHTIEGATKLGELLGKKCSDAGIKTAVFDRAGYRYHGKVKALAEAARQAGLIF